MIQECVTSYNETVSFFKNFGGSFDVSWVSVLGIDVFSYVTQLYHFQEHLNTQFDIVAHITSAVISAQ